MFDIGSRLAMLALASALIWIAFRIHKSNGSRAPWVGICFGVLAGLGLLGTVAGEWIAVLMSLGTGVVGLLVLLITGTILAIDLKDRKPDKPALIAAIILPIAITYGIAQFDQVPEMVGTGASRVQAGFEEAQE